MRDSFVQLLQVGRAGAWEARGLCLVGQRETEGRG